MPKKLVLLEISEENLYKINEELLQIKKENIKIISILGSSSNFKLVSKTIKDNNIDIYAHFWWSEEYKFKTNRLHVNEKFEEKPVEDFINLYKPKKIVYEECPDREVDLTSINGWNKEKCEDEQEMNVSSSSSCGATGIID